MDPVKINGGEPDAITRADSCLQRMRLLMLEHPEKWTLEMEGGGTARLTLTVEHGQYPQADLPPFSIPLEDVKLAPAETKAEEIPTFGVISVADMEDPAATELEVSEPTVLESDSPTAATDPKDKPADS